MINIYEAIKIIQEKTKILGVEKCSLANAFGRVLAEDVYSDMDMPPFDKSAMDGYAVYFSDLDRCPKELYVKNIVRAGKFCDKDVQKIQRGECVKIMTGAPVPLGLDAVVMVEDTLALDNDVVKINKGVLKGTNICKKGEDIQNGECVLRKGVIIRGTETAVLASVGKVEVLVQKKPTVAIISTGDEIVEPDTMPSKGEIRNSNGSMLSSLVKSTGCDVQYLGIVKDNKKAFEESLSKGLEADILLLSGGVSMGDFDLVPNMLKEAGVEISFHNVKVKPGKPLIFGKKDKTIVFGIPGNPVSNFTTFNIFIKSSIHKMMGYSDYNLKLIEGEITVEFKKKIDRTQIAPCICALVNGKYEVTPLGINGSADIFGSAGCNSLMIVDKDKSYIKKGERVEWVKV